MQKKRPVDFGFRHVRQIVFLTVPPGDIDELYAAAPGRECELVSRAYLGKKNSVTIRRYMLENPAQAV
jgi:hypothetical protein